MGVMKGLLGRIMGMKREKMKTVCLLKDRLHRHTTRAC